jgi:integrase
MARNNNIHTIKGKKGNTYKVLIRRKVNGVNETFCETFKTLKEARKKRDEIQGDSSKLKRSRTPFKELAEQYARQYKGKDSRSSQRLGYWTDLFGTADISTITRPIIAKEYHSLYQEPALVPRRKGPPLPSNKTRTRATANRYLSTLSQVFELAVDMNLIEVNPCKGIKRGGETHHFGRALSDAERKELLKQCQKSEYDRLYLLVSMALSTGARLGELMSLTWADLDLKKAVAKLSETKNGSPRHLPIIPPVLEQIKALPRPIDSATFLFPGIEEHENAYHYFRRYWDEALEKAGIEDFRFHDLRHSAASYLTEASVPLVTVAEILGHKTMTMVQRYSHVATSHKAEVVNETFKVLLG